MVELPKDYDYLMVFGPLGFSYLVTIYQQDIPVMFDPLSGIIDDGYPFVSSTGSQDDCYDPPQALVVLRWRERLNLWISVQGGAQADQYKWSYIVMGAL